MFTHPHKQKRDVRKIQPIFRQTGRVLAHARGRTWQIVSGCNNCPEVFVCARARVYCHSVCLARRAQKLFTSASVRRHRVHIVMKLEMGISPRRDKCVKYADCCNKNCLCATHQDDDVDIRPRTGRKVVEGGCCSICVRVVWSSQIERY